MKKSLLKFALLLGILFGQNGTEVYLFDLVSKDGIFSIENPLNISNNPGYDNQPSFMKNGRSVVYASTRNDQTDIVSYNIRTGKSTWLTDSEGSEYSPVQIGSSNSFSAIRLDKDGTQLLYKYSMYSNKGRVLIPELKVGYHGWVDRNQILAFVLGEPSTLQLFSLKSGNSQILDKKIGRSIHKIPQTYLMSYVSKKTEVWTINSLDTETGVTDIILPTRKGSEDLVWAPSGIIFMGAGNILYQFDPKYNSDWIALTDITVFGLSGITRLAVSPKEDKIVIVVAEKSASQ